MAKKNAAIYEEYFMNENMVKKLYHMYLHQSVFDKILDVLVFFAIIFTVMGVVLEILVDLDNHILHLIHSFSIIILVIFVIELFRDYAKSKTSREFLKKHWIDLVLVSLLSMYFIFSYFGLARLRLVGSFKAYLQEAKQYRVIFNIFKK